MIIYDENLESWLQEEKIFFNDFIFILQYLKITYLYFSSDVNFINLKIENIIKEQKIQGMLPSKNNTLIKFTRQIKNLISLFVLSATSTEIKSKFNQYLKLKAFI